MLYLVPTPIGNLEDMTFRAINILKEVDLVLAEDTRVSQKLLKKYEIETRLQSFHAHNEHKKLNHYLELLQTGTQLALVSDAGTPGISDPGFLLVRACNENDIKVNCLPGATAFVPALVMSGIPCDRFHFEGFLPQKKGKQKRLKYLLDLENTIVFYESPFRIVKTLKMIQELGGGDRLVSVSRELTKIYEENVRGNLAEVLETLKSRSSIKGEIVLVISGKNGLSKNEKSDE